MTSVIANMLLRQNDWVKVICAPVATNYAPLVRALLNMFV